MNKKMSLSLFVASIAASFTLAADQPGINDIPDVKEGLWESSTMMGGATEKPVRTTMCTSNAVSRKMYEDTHKNSRCKTINSERHGSVITSEVECNFNGKVQRSKHVTKLTGNTEVHLETRAEDGTVKTVIDMKWVGACPAGMKLGDVTGPDGKVLYNALSR
jgi:Protein of unknown function (DUF3617)